MEKKLINAVVRQLGYEPKDLTAKNEDLMSTLQDICNNGIGGGFSGFIYYSDTVPFYKKNRKSILALVNEMAFDLGESPIELVAGFNCLKGYDPKSFETQDEIGRTLYGRLKDDDTQIANALAWFAAEEVARFITDEMER